MDEPISFFRGHRESSMLAIALVDFSIHIVDIDSKRVIRKFYGHTSQITDITFTPDSRWLVSSSMDCSIRTWNIPSAQLIDQFRTQDACISLSLSPTGECLATAHINYLGIFLWTNVTLYSHITLKALTPSDDPALVQLPEVMREPITLSEETKEEIEFISPEQISNELITMSGLSTSRWQNLLSIDIIRKKNKPKQPPKAPKAAPFFLPTIPSLNLQFNLENNESTDTGSKLLLPAVVQNLSEFGKLLEKTADSGNFSPVIHKVKNFGPSMIEFELKNLSPDAGGSASVMLQFLKCIEYMLKSNKDFELAQSYLAVFLKFNGNVITEHELLRNYLPNVQCCLSVTWERLQEKLLYNICVIKSKKTM